MANAEQLITDNLGLWSSAKKKRSSAGRGSSKKLEHYGVSKLRELILNLAIQGKLVPNISHETPIPHDSHNDFDSINHQNPPLNWRTIFLSDGIKNKSGNSKLIKGKLFGEPAPGLFQGFSASGPDVWCENFEYEGEAIIVSAVGARCGKAFKATGKWCAIANTNICWPNPDLFTLGFACLILDNEKFWIRSGSAQPFVKFPPSLKRTFSLPPLAEQKRIVAKVDELMSLCDRLEQEQENILETHETLVSTLLNALTSAAADASQFADYWQRIQANFDILFTTESSVDQLKQTILQLAVMGKLVEQDSDDESAALNLRTLKAKQLAMFADEKLRKRTAIQPQNRNDWQYEIPTNWAFSNFEEVSVIVSGVTKGRKLSGRKTRRLPYLRVANVQRHYLDLEVIKDIEVLDKDLESYKLVTGDVLMTEGGDWDKLGRAAIWQDEIKDCIHQNHIYRVRSADKDILLPRWIELFANSPPGRRFFESASKQTTNLASINMTQLRGCPLPLPPTKEQHRIVAKVDALFTLCDHLRTRLYEAQETQLTLADSISEQAIQSPA